MTDYTFEERYNRHYQEIAALLTDARAKVAYLEAELLRIYPYTTAFRLEQVQETFRKDSHNEKKQSQTLKQTNNEI